MSLLYVSLDALIPTQKSRSDWPHILGHRSVWRGQWTLVEWLWPRRCCCLGPSEGRERCDHEGSHHWMVLETQTWTLASDGLPAHAGTVIPHYQHSNYSIVTVITSLPKVIWEEGHVAAKVSPHWLQWCTPNSPPKVKPSHGLIPKPHYLSHPWTHLTYDDKQQLHPIRHFSTMHWTDWHTDRHTDRSSTGKSDDYRLLCILRERRGLIIITN